MRQRTRVIVGCALALTMATATPAAHADPRPVEPVTSVSDAVPGARVTAVSMLTEQRAQMFVFSPSMGRDIQVQVLLPADRSVPRPSLYMLDGVSAGEESDYTESTWTQKTDAEQFFADKNVNVVLPVGGRGSYYADWNLPDPVLGVNKWETFLTSELPPLVDAQFGTNGINTLMGLSMGAQGAMNLMTKHPDLYSGVAGFSGCYDNRTDATKNAVRATVASEGGDATNMWGTNADVGWAENDPSLRLEALRGKTVYVSSGNGFPGPYEFGGAPGSEVLEAFTSGAPLEMAANICTHGFSDSLRAAGIPATVVFKPFGTHQWKYWEDELHASWPVVSRALGL